jgi:hypothetical protein
VVDVARVLSQDRGADVAIEAAVILGATNDFTGGIDLSSGTLDLAAPGAAGAGPITFDPSPDPVLRFSAADVPTNPIDNFTQGDTIEITGFVATGSNYVSGILALDGSGGPIDLNLPGVTASDLQVNADTGSDETTFTSDQLPCFLPGTLIRTGRGEIAVETLKAADTVLTLGGQQRRLCWIGRGRALATRGRRSAATPIIVRKGALADNVPFADLRITKGHSLYIDGVLIPAEFLVNHRSILWDDRAQEVTVFHLELDTHDVLLANGAAAESYRDDGNRWLFQNANSGWGLPPQEPCAPVLTGGPIVDAAWQRLLDRAGSRPGLTLTGPPDLHLLVDGRRVDRSRGPNGYYVFDLPRRTRELRVVSRAGSPAELGFARDPRVLGVAVRQIRLWQGTRLRVLDASDPALVEGFHAFEPDNGFRWTDGDAALPATLFADIEGACQLELLVGGAMRYPLFAEAVRRVAA